MIIEALTKSIKETEMAYLIWMDVKDGDPFILPKKVVRVIEVTDRAYVFDVPDYFKEYPSDKEGYEFQIDYVKDSKNIVKVIE